MLPEVPPRLHNRIRKPSTLMPPRRRIHPPAALYCYRPWTYPLKQRVWSAATTPGPARMYTSARRKACPHLCLKYLYSQADPKFGSRYIITSLNLSAYTPDKPWAPSRSSPSPTHHRPHLPPARTASRLSQDTSHPPAATAKSPLPRVQRHHQPERKRLGLHSTALAHHRYRGTSTPPAISSPKRGRT